MASILHYIQYTLGWLFYPIRGHDSYQIIFTCAFKDLPEPNMTLDAIECGPSGSKMLLHHTCLAGDGTGCIPELQWAPPETDQSVKEYVLICEDLDVPIPFMVLHHGLFWGIPPSATRAGAHETSIPQVGPDICRYFYNPIVRYRRILTQEAEPSPAGTSFPTCVESPTWAPMLPWAMVPIATCLPLSPSKRLSAFLSPREPRRPTSGAVWSVKSSDGANGPESSSAPGPTKPFGLRNPIVLMRK